MALKDCPFCGGNHLKQWGNSDFVQVCCMKCRAMGPRMPTEREAYIAWNKAISLSELRQVVMERKEKTDA